MESLMESFGLDKLIPLVDEDLKIDIGNGVACYYEGCGSNDGWPPVDSIPVDTIPGE